MRGPVCAASRLSRLWLLQGSAGSHRHGRGVTPGPPDRFRHILMRIAVDVMGGDHGCGVVVKGVKLALEADSSISVILVGKKEQVRAALDEAALNESRV